LLRELEASLLGSRAALLALDLEGIERGTREQVDLVGKLEANRRLGRALAGPELAEDFERCAARVGQAGRVQAALLARARAKLRVLANMLAGPSCDYGFVVSRSQVQAGIFRAGEAGRI
jgi:hypothetical protein